MSGAAALLMSSARSCHVRCVAPRAPDNAALLELAQASLLAAVVEHDPDNQQHHYQRGGEVGGHDEGGVGTERHGELTPVARRARPRSPHLTRRGPASSARTARAAV